MASTPFTLAALATSAVPGLTVTGTRSHTSGSGGAFSSAVLETDRGVVIIRIPEQPSAEVQQSAELLGLASLAEGARAALPFAVPRTLGITRAGDTRAVVSTLVPGTPSSLDAMESDPSLLAGVAEAIAAVHSLPASMVRDSGLPSRDAQEVRSVTVRLIDRAAQTGLLPATVQQRWNEVLQTESVWSFEPTVIHGSLSEDLFLVGESGVQGLLGWSELSLGDPAADLSWFLGAGVDLYESALARYTLKRNLSGQQDFTVRAKFYHELEVARWLLHGVETRDDAIVEDAVSMFDRLVDRLSSLGTALPQRRVLSELEVEEMLEHTPEIEHDPRSETAEFESLDEDRVFTSDEDFQEDAGEPVDPDADKRPSAGE